MGLLEGDGKRLRECGLNWEYCDGNCTGCTKYLGLETSTTTTPVTKFDPISTTTILEEYYDLRAYPTTGGNYFKLKIDGDESC